jgi:LuxR family maltose regulon positive regulatory protein
MLAFIRLLMSEVQYERNDLQEALANLQKAYDYYDLAKSWHRFVCQANVVELHQALGDVEKALEWLRKLQRNGERTEYAHRGIPFAVWIAERSLLLSQLRPDLDDLFAEALNWAEESGLDPGDDFTGEREYEYVTLARVMIADNRAARALPLLDRLSQSAERTGRWGDLIAILLLQAIAHKNLGNRAFAFNHLARALVLARPEGYIRSFVDLGPPMRELLQEAAGKGINAAYITKLLAAFPTQEPAPAHPLTSPPAHLAEPLNDREMQILRLMSARLSNREIAEELYLSVNTVKWYARSIFHKLGVSNRRDAGSRARDLRLL